MNHNNRVEPNFHSDSYQRQARDSFKKRMQYNPMESAKKRPNTNNIQSEYAQQKLNESMDASHNLVQRPSEFKLFQSHSKSGINSALNRSMDQITVPPRSFQKPRVQSVAPC